MVSGYQADLHGEENMAYALIVSIEEVFEMLGVIVFIHSLREYLQKSVQVISIGVPQEIDAYD